MDKVYKTLLAGFGGQGILFAGKVLAYSGVVNDKYVSWLPSYGPEMRGGTANCHVIVSDKPVGSPIIVNPTGLIVMNKPSMEKFESTVVSGGIIIMDSSLIDIKSNRDDIKQFAIPATQMATDIHMPKLANMIMLGKYLKETGIADLETVKKGLEKSISAKRQNLYEANWTAIETGYNYN